jgi:anti-sigma regulatory factor (Ser/Thr protein kinase)
MTWHVARTFRGDAHSPSRARAFCTEQLTAALAHRPDVGELAEDARVITSELVTNAVQAGSDRIRYSMTLDDGELRLNVHDDADGVPVLTEGEPGALSGRGLMITAALADDWGVEPEADGKAVWAVLRV